MAVQHKFLLIMLQIILMKMMIVTPISLMDVESVMVMIAVVPDVQIPMRSILVVIMEKYRLATMILPLMMVVVSTIRKNSNLINPKCRHFIL